MIRIIAGFILGWGVHWIWSEYRLKKQMGFYDFDTI